MSANAYAAWSRYMRRKYGPGPWPPDRVDPKDRFERWKEQRESEIRPRNVYARRLPYGHVRWVAQVTINRRSKYLGMFNTAEEAAAAVAEAERALSSRVL